MSNEKLTTEAIMKDFQEDFSNCIEGWVKKAEETQENIREIQIGIDSGKYADAIVKELREKQRLEKRKIKGSLYDMCGQMEKQANDVIAKYSRLARSVDCVRGDELMADSALFTSGLKLTQEDIDSVAGRNAQNPTMSKLIIQYCKDNNLKEPSISLQSWGKGHRLSQEIEGYKVSVGYAAKWLDHPDARNILRKFPGLGLQ